MTHPIQVQSGGGVAGAQRPRQQPPPLTGKFASLLDQAREAQGTLRFSAHAMQRLSERNIQLSAADHARIAKSTEAASAKGAREALLIMDQLALVVGVPNRTVITVMEPTADQHTVFTNIDSVVVVGSE